MKRPLYKANAFWLLLSIALFLISGIGTAVVQTAGGAVTMKTLTWETPSGKTQSIFLLKPNDASSTNKRPAIVVSHGYNNSKQMEDLNYIELAKRGYVVISDDRYSHGGSDNVKASDIGSITADAASGIYDDVKLLATLPYVDATRIGVSGHSMGCDRSDGAMVLDDQAKKQLIAAAYLVDCSPIVTDAKGKYTDVYGNRSVGVMADQYDEFYFRQYDAKGNVTAPPRDFITSPTAQAFLHFSTDPSGKDVRKSYTTYSQDVDGVKALREIDNPAQIHPWALFSSTASDNLIAFFEKAMPAPNPISPGSQTWQLKAGFNGLGLVALAMFLVAFTKALLNVRLFAGLRVAGSAARPIAGARGHAWFWGALVVSAVVSAVSFVVFAESDWAGSFTFTGTPFINPQGPTSFIGIWAAINGLFALVAMVVSYHAFGRRNGQDLREVGVLPGWRKFWLGVLLAVLVVLAVVGILFLEDYFFQADFRLYVLGITTFGADKIWMIFLYLPFYLVFYVFNSIAVNSFNRFTHGGREWVNTAILAILNALPAIAVVAIEYIGFAVTGLEPWAKGEMPIAGIWLQYVIPFLLVTVIITRKIFRVTNNPYIGGIIMALIATIASVSTTITIAG